MYSSLKNVQILISLLKQYGIKHIVISAGTRHTPLVYSVEHDSYFTTYSIVDERSASFFAIGLIEELREPVAICCTSGTASANYVSAANEAFYQQLPLLILTADRNHYYMFQQEEQMIPQEGLYSAVCKKVVTLPHVRDDKDFWYCSRICNEALMELRHGENGPVHINFIIENDYPIKQGIVNFETEELPIVKKTERLVLEDSEETWKEWAKKLQTSKVLIVYGQHAPLTVEEAMIVENFAKKCNCVFAVDLLSNLHVNYAIPTFPICNIYPVHLLKNVVPDILITMNGNTISDIKAKMSNYKEQLEHWHVSAKGEISDPLKCLPNTIECTPNTFFKKFATLLEDEVQHTYHAAWDEIHKSFGKNGSLKDETIPYSAVYATQQYMKLIPENSLLHIANSNSIRIANFFEVVPSVCVYGNRGAHGIDGSMSSFIGQAYVSNKLSFLLIGDLSFFYDMNALWNKYVGKNVRILVCNNSGGGIFHNYPNKKNVPTLDEHIAAEHNTSVKEWVVSRGFKYLSAKNKEELDEAMKELMTTDSDRPILLEAFTDKDVDVQTMRMLVEPFVPVNASIKRRIGSMLPQGVKNTIKDIIK